MTEGRSATQQVSSTTPDSLEEKALDTLVKILRLKWPGTDHARLDCDGLPFIHVGDGKNTIMTFELGTDKCWTLGEGLMTVGPFAAFYSLADAAGWMAAMTQDHYAVMSMTALAMLGG